MSNFTYEIIKSGFDKTIIVYSNSRPIYKGTPSSTASEETLVREAKIALKDNYGPGINQMVKSPSVSTSNITPSPSQPSQAQLSSNQSQINKVSDQQKAKTDDLEKATDNKINFLKKQATQSSRDIKGQIVSAVTPILLSFIRTENIADILIRKITKDTKKQLLNKGTLIVTGGKFTFTPSSPGNYTIFKTDFDRRVTNLKTTINNLQRTITLLNNIVRYLNIALSIVQTYIRIKQSLMLSKLARITAELAAPVKSKPTSGANLLRVIRSLQQLEKDSKKVEEYQNAITAVKTFLVIFKEMLTKIQTKINQLQFNIITPQTRNNNSNQTSNILSSGVTIPFDILKGTAPETEEYADQFGKKYTLKLVTLPNGFKQYQALDAFSKLKISQTAPSKIKTPEQLLEEIKSILG